MLISPVNFSEGERAPVVARIADAARRFCALLDVHSDSDHNRCVVTLAGEPAPLLEGILAAAKEALQLIDLNTHRGVHPRLGAIDVVPFVPPAGSDLPESSLQGVIATSAACAHMIWERLGVPCFLYELSSRDDTANPTALPDVRRSAFATRQPDFGGPGPHPTAGAAAVGARGPLVAYNVNLDSSDIRVAREIASHLRTTLPFVRSLGLPLASRGCVQVSTNLIRPQTTSIPNVFGVIAGMARSRNVEVLESETVGLVPFGAFAGGRPSSFLFSREPKILEDVLEESIR